MNTKLALLRRTAVSTILMSTMLVSTGFLFNKGESITLYNVTLYSKEIAGTSKFRESGDRFYTAIPTDLPTMRESDLVNLVGSYRPNSGSPNALDLFSLSSRDAPYKLLDEIDFDFYRAVSFNELQAEPDYDSKYKAQFLFFKSDFDNASDNKVRKQVISNYPLIKLYLIKSRLEMRKDSFTLKRTSTAKLTASLKAELTGIQVEGADVSASVKGYLSKLADESFSIKSYYYTSRLRHSYVTHIQDKLEVTPVEEYGDDLFSRNLRKCIEPNSSAAINSQIVAVKLKGSLNKNKINEAQIASDLSGKYGIPADKARQIAASASFAFTNKVERNLSTFFDNIFFVRYTTSSIVDKLEPKKG